LIWIYIAISNPFITGKLGFKDGNNSFEAWQLGVSKKIEKPIKPREPEKKITEKIELWKKPIKILKKPTGSVSVL